MFDVMEKAMGTAEIAARLGVSRQRVQQLVARPDFPKPFAVLVMGIVWLTDDVEAWVREHRPDLGEPPEELPTGTPGRGRSTKRAAMRARPHKRSN